MSNDQPVFNTIGRDRTDCIETAKGIIRQGDFRNHKHLHIENERYYDSLDDGESKQDLKQKWDQLAGWKQKQISEWKNRYDSSDAYDRHDLLTQRDQILWLYENERFVQVEHNYHYFKTYWDGSTTDYDL